MLSLFVIAVFSVWELGCQQNWPFCYSFICILVFPLHYICVLHWSCSDQLRTTPRTAVILTTQLSHNQETSSLMAQHKPPDPTVRKHEFSLHVFKNSY